MSGTARSVAPVAGSELPGDDVGVVLHPGDQDLVSGGERAPAPALGDEIDALGGAPGEDDLLRRRGVHEPGDPVADGVVRRGGPLAQVVDAAMDVGVLGRIEAADGLDDRPGLLAGRGIVEIDQGLAVDPPGKDREILPEPARRRAQGRRGVPRSSAPQRPPRRSRTRRSSSWRTGASATSSTTSAAKA